MAFGALEEVEAGEAGGGLGWWRCGGVDEAAGFVDEEVDPRLGGGEVSASRADGFAEGAHLEVDLGLEVEFFGEALTGGPEDSEGVCFIEEEEGSVLFFEVYDFAEGAEVAVHGEDGFGDDEGTAFARDEELFELVEVVVWEDAEGGAGESRGVDEAGVGEFVEDDGVSFFDDCGDGSKGGGVAVGEGEGGVGFFVVGDLFFELVVWVEAATDESRGGGAGAVVGECLGSGLDEGGVFREAEVVV